DFTYIDDIIEGVNLILKKESVNEKYQLYNIGNNKPVKLLDFIEAIEKVTGRKAKKIFLPMQPGDVNQTWANVNDLTERYGYQPNYSIEKGVMEFIKWYYEYYL